jgi:ATP adenylyltransferase
MAERPTSEAEPAASGGETVRPGDCPFCAEAFRGQAVETCGSVFAVPDAHPVTDGHMLVVPFRHTRDFFSMSPAERRDADELLRRLSDRTRRSDPTVTGFNVGANCGASAGQRILHAHIHLIPRRDDEAHAGRGLKGVIRNKMAY